MLAEELREQLPVVDVFQNHVQMALRHLRGTTLLIALLRRRVGVTMDCCLG